MKLLLSMPSLFPSLSSLHRLKVAPLRVIGAPTTVAQPSNPKRESEAICLGLQMSLIYTLFYRRGSFAQSEIFGSLKSAMSRARGVFNLEGYSAFSIEDGGGVVMHNSQIEEHCRAARFALLSGRMPERSL
jgi:hypothetical protein